MPKIAAKIDPIERDIAVLFPDAFSPRQRSQTLAQFAQVEIKKADDQNAAVMGHRMPHTIFVDGAEGAPLNQVKPDGVIVAEWTLYEEMFDWIREKLQKHSPIGGVDKRPGHPGLYRASHAFLADSSEVLPGEAVPPADEYVFVNTVPYARKIERGLSAQAPDGVYETVAVMASRRWGNLARVRFSYRSPLFGGIQQWATGTRMQTRAKGPRRRDWLTRQPAIVISPRR
jgi:hypothetical protein